MKPGPSVWECPVCIRQMVGGPRCTEHNPTPEAREQQRASVSRQTAEDKEDSVC